ncbi:hypothetical protein HKX48_008558 [Thoreauomyces humboldtii]|nr:hypothetical protein HKX48_008558 [Thoreauomyces humboldtii]
MRRTIARIWNFGWSIPKRLFYFWAGCIFIVLCLVILIPASFIYCCKYLLDGDVDMGTLSKVFKALYIRRIKKDKTTEEPAMPVTRSTAAAEKEVPYNLRSKGPVEVDFTTVPKVTSSAASSRRSVQSSHSGRSRVSAASPSPSPVPTIKVVFQHQSPLTLQVSSDTTVADLKLQILKTHTLTPGTKLRIAHSRRELHDDRLPISTYVVPTFFVSIPLRLDPLPCPERFKAIFPAELMDPEWDRDYTVNCDDKTAVSRGGHKYARPKGWWRFGLKVKGKYEDDKWLGEVGPRSKSSKGEWMVTYHGTAYPNAASIARQGYNTTEVWSTTELPVTMSYSARGHYPVGTGFFRVVMQNRVDPKRVTPQGAGSGIFTARSKFVRPYAILVQPAVGLYN